MNRLHALAVFTAALVLCASATAQDGRGNGGRTRPPMGGVPGGAAQPGTPPMGFPQPGGPGGPGGTPGGAPVGRTEAYKELIPALVEALGDKEGDIRQYAAHGLSRMGPESVTQLADLLKNADKSKIQRANAAYVLGKIGGQAREALPALTKAMKDPDKELRRRAAFAVASIVGNDWDFGGFGGMGPGGPPPGFGPGGFAGGSSKLPDPGLLLPDKTDDTKSTSSTKEEKKDDRPPK